jgi:hypothetical protein
MSLRPLRPTCAVALAACVHATLGATVATPAWAQQQPIPLQPQQPTTLQPAGQPAPQPPPPQTGVRVVPGGDSVFMNNGSVLRGTIVELLPDHVTVQLPTGQLAIIPAKDIHHIERQAAAAPGAVVAPPPVAPAGPGAVLVHIDSPQEVSLMRKEGKAWSLACSAPCDAMLSTGDTYRIQGSGVASSAEFRLSGSPGSRVVLHVDPASSGTKAGGWIIFGLGTAVFVVGLGVMLVGALYNTTNRIGGSSSSKVDGDALVATGGIMTGVGLAGLVGGLVMAITAKTRADQEVQPRAASVDDRWLRSPSWSETARLSSPRDDAPRTLSVPIFGGTF